MTERKPRGGWLPPGPDPDEAWQAYFARFPDPPAPKARAVAPQSPRTRKRASPAPIQPRTTAAGHDPAQLDLEDYL